MYRTHCMCVGRQFVSQKNMLQTDANVQNERERERGKEREKKRNTE